MGISPIAIWGFIVADKPNKIPTITFFNKEGMLSLLEIVTAGIIRARARYSLCNDIFDPKEKYHSPNKVAPAIATFEFILFIQRNVTNMIKQSVTTSVILMPIS